MEINCSGNLNEVFPSLQGEGYFSGALQLFIRFSGCNLKCQGCDTKYSWETPDFFFLQPMPGKKHVKLANPILPSVLVKAIGLAYPLELFHSVSLTGGEPLLQDEFALCLAKYFREMGTKVFLETNGTYSGAISQISPHVNFWSVDLKFSSCWGLKEENRSAHEHFLKRLPPSRTFLKMVVSETDTVEMILKQFNNRDYSKFRLTIQPYSFPSQVRPNADLGKIFFWFEALQPIFKEVRWLPQIHKLLHIP